MSTPKNCLQTTSIGISLALCFHSQHPAGHLTVGRTSDNSRGIRSLTQFNPVISSNAFRSRCISVDSSSNNGSHNSNEKSSYRSDNVVVHQYLHDGGTSRHTSLQSTRSINSFHTKAGQALEGTTFFDDSSCKRSWHSSHMVIAFKSSSL